MPGTCTILRSVNGKSVRNWINDLTPQINGIFTKLGVKNQLIEKLSNFADYLDAFKRAAKPKTLQPKSVNYGLCVVGAGEIIGLDVLMTNQKSSLFSYKVLSDKFSFYVVPQMALQLIFDRRVLHNATNVFLSTIEHRLASMVIKLNSSILSKEEDRITFRDGQLVYVEDKVDLDGVAAVRDIELEILYDKIMKQAKVEVLAEVQRKSKVMNMMELEKELLPDNLPNTRKSRL